MKEETIYICSICGNRSKFKEDIEYCELVHTRPKIKNINVKKLKEFLNKAPDNYKLCCGCGTNLTNAEIIKEEKSVMLFGR